ncbi:MAG: DNA polymerase III subunit gamma/tau [Anaerolineae bacterium]
MATQALYRKWRSRTFDEVIGQDHVTRTLKNALATDRVAHAYLFTGPRGTGKTTTARLLAKAVNCLGEADARPCGVCNICQAVDEGRLLDLIEIDAASNRGIDEIRDLREKVGFRPGEARVKFYIIDEVHMLTDPAFNALLKTLEEPPPHVIFVLATTEPHKIPATIVSRCQRFDFRRIPLREVTRWLTHIAEEEGLQVEPEALEYIARQGGGSMRDAISLLDQLTAYGSDIISLAQVRAVLGSVASQAVYELIESLIDGDLARGLDVINQVVSDGAEPRQFTREFVEYLRGLLLLKMGDGASLLRASVPDEMLARMGEQARKLSPRALLRATRLFNAAALEMKVGFLPQLPLELAFVEAVVDEAERDLPAPEEKKSEPAPVPQKSASSPAPSTSPLEARPARQPVSKSPAAADTGTPAPSPAAAPASSPARGDVSFETVQQNWSNILAQLRQTNKMVEALMRSVNLVGVEGNSVVVEVPSDLLKGRIEQPTARSCVEQGISQVIGAPASLRCVLKGTYHGRTQHPPEPAPQAPSQTNETTDAAESDVSSEKGAEEGSGVDIEDDPMVREALSLGAEIKNVE